MYKLKSGYEGKSRITTSEYYLLPFGERMHYEFEDEGSITTQSTGFPDDVVDLHLEEELPSYFPQETPDNEPDEDNKFSGMGGGDFGGGGSSDSFETPNSSNDSDTSSDSDD